MPEYNPEAYSGRARAETASTVSTAVPPKVEDSDFMLDLGGDLSNMLSKFDKRSSVATFKERNLTGNRASQPAPLRIGHSAPVEPSPHSLNSQNSNDGLLESARMYSSPPVVSPMERLPPPVPRHDSPTGPRASEDDQEDTILLSDSLAATQYLSSSAGTSGATFIPHDTRGPSYKSGVHESHGKASRFGPKPEDDNLFETSFGRPSRVVPRIGGHSNSQPHNKVMTPAEFEKYRRDKAQEERMGLVDADGSDKEEDEENYDDEEDDLEKSKQAATQRRRQEAHMSVYRQQMMKVTGESSTNRQSRPGISVSMSTPNLPSSNVPGKGLSPSPPSDGSEEDEEIPLAILAAHGFPSRNRPPTRLSGFPSNPNLRASMQPSYTAGPGSVAGDSNVQGGSGGRLPPFARKLPQDPYLGAGLINQPPRESFALGGGAPAQGRATSTGGLVGVIADEERSRAMRRGSPAVNAVNNANTALPPNMQMNGVPMNGAFDSAHGIPPQMMYPMGMQHMPGPMLTPGDQAQIQMTQQMQQFMQMQMQFMEMMTSQGQSPGLAPPRPQGHMPTQSMGAFGDGTRNSFLGDTLGSMGGGMSLEVPRPDSQARTMSMIQPSSASWIQHQPQPGYAPSRHAQGMGYAPSIAPSERSNIGLPGRYRPVSSINPLEQSGRTSTMSGAMPHLQSGRTSTMSGALPQLQSKLQTQSKVSSVNREDDDDDEEGWEAMKAKREKKKSMWRSKKNYGSDIGALIS
ncbi:Uu.00g042920.m01.CDS01 [Anthostomella pinea]|uniref:Uu.00g042920.m01.CDS01 n=1 Tax=Anthostomella pinea TaxID=933095 RepID=A0AAI8VAM3_9PEZI|nr:Uu.00g042920.m01.CDS01 [Anthostomella pinea]